MVPQTYATSSQRFKVIDHIVRRHPAIGWKLLLGLAPRSYDTVARSSLPNWRDFAQSEPEDLTWASVAKAAIAVGDRLLDLAGDDPARWHALLRLWSDFVPAWRTKAAGRLSTFAGRLNDPREIKALRNEFPALLHQHRSFQDADWTMAEDSLEQLDEILAVLRPVAVEDRVRWLFKSGAFAPGVGPDWPTQQSALKALRAEAAKALVTELPFDKVVAFSATVEAHHELSAAIAMTHAPDATKHELLRYGLLAEEQGLADLASGVLVACGEGWRDRRIPAARSLANGDRRGLGGACRVAHRRPPASGLVHMECRGGKISGFKSRILTHSSDVSHRCRCRGEPGR